MTTKPWRGTFSVADDNSLFQLVYPEFMNSLADAHSLTILSANNNNHVLTHISTKDSEAAIRAVVNCVRDNSPRPYTPGPEAQGPQEAPTSASAGTAFFVAPNLLVTNHHVVQGCRSDIQVRYPERRPHTATISGLDETNDLALLHTDMDNLAVASFRSWPPRVGDAVAVYGFPYPFELSSEGNFTLGSVTALSGFKNDSRFIQVQAPIQPGNSGGPLLDMSSSVIGVVESMLSPFVTMQRYGTVPQNVNFAIHTPIVVNFLAAKGVTAKLDTDAHRSLTSSDVADLAKKFTVQVYCQAPPPKTSEASPPPGKSPESKNPPTGLEQQAKELVLSLQAKSSRPNSEALAGLVEFYQNEVMYYGQKITKNQVIKEKEAFYRKFPVREYKPKEPISARCSGSVCTVRGCVDFRAIDPAAKVLSEGVASFEYQLTGIDLKISQENGEVKSRTRTPLPSTTSQEHGVVPNATRGNKIPDSDEIQTCSIPPQLNGAVNCSLLIPRL